MMFDTMQTSFVVKSAIKSIFKKMIDKHQKIYMGNLAYWVKDKLPEAVDSDMEGVFHELADEGFFCSASDGMIYSPDAVNLREAQITSFISKFGLSMMDLDILLAIDVINEENLLRGREPRLSMLSRLIVSQYSCYGELQVKIRVQEFLISRLLRIAPSKRRPERIEVNWKLMREVLVDEEYFN